MDSNLRKQPLLKLKFEGSAIHDGRMLYDDLETFVSNVSLAIERLINKIQIGTSVKRGRPQKQVKVLSALEIVSIKRGSFSISLDLRRDGQQFPGWDIGEEAINKLMIGLQAIKNEGKLPQEYDPGILISLRDAGRIMDKGVDRIKINSSSAVGTKRVEYTQPLREQIVTRIKRFEYGYTAIEGRLTMIDAEEDKLRCRLRPSTGEPITCKYDEELTDQVMKYIRQFVQARGDATYEVNTGKITSLYIKDLELIEEVSSLSPTPPSSFWKSKTVEELASEQGVYPIIDWEQLTSQWPENTDFDEFLNAIRSSRN